jgi:hypothetical protein
LLGLPRSTSGCSQSITRPIRDGSCNRFGGSTSWATLSNLSLSTMSFSAALIALFTLPFVTRRASETPSVCWCKLVVSGRVHRPCRADVRGGGAEVCLRHRASAAQILLQCKGFQRCARSAPRFHRPLICAVVAGSAWPPTSRLRTRASNEPSPPPTAKCTAAPPRPHGNIDPLSTSVTPLQITLSPTTKQSPERTWVTRPTYPSTRYR